MAGDWLPAGESADIEPRRGVRRCVEGREVALFRTGEGELLVVDNACPHRGGALFEGLVTGRTVVCPLHGWGIDLGSGRAVPPEEGGVATHAVREHEGQVEVRLAKSVKNPTEER